MPNAHLTEIDYVWSILARSVHSKPEATASPKSRCSAGVTLLKVSQSTELTERERSHVS